MDVACEVISTGTPKNTRTKIGRSFEDGSTPVILISVSAAVAEASVTTASRAILFDSSCDMDTDGQALACATRLGQTRDLEIYRLVGAGTLEEGFCASVRGWGGWGWGGAVSASLG